MSPPVSFTANPLKSNVKTPYHETSCNLNKATDPAPVNMWLHSHYVHPTGGWTYYFCIFRCLVSAVRRPTWFPDILGNSSYPIFTKFGMQVYWVNSLYGIAFGDDSSIAN